MNRPHTDIFRAVADPTRRAILAGLRVGPQSVNEIADNFKVSRPAISKHLRILRDAKLVREEREGRYRVYTLSAEPLVKIERWLTGYREFWDRKLSKLKKHVEAQKDKID